MMNSSSATIQEESGLIAHPYAQEDDPEILQQQLQSQQDDDQEDDYEAPPHPHSSAAAVLPRLSPPAFNSPPPAVNHCSACGAQNPCGRDHRMKRRLPFSSSNSAAVHPAGTPAESKTKKEEQEQKDQNFTNKRRSTSDPTPATAMANLDDSPSSRRLKMMWELLKTQYCHLCFSKFKLFSSRPSSSDGPNKRRSIPATPSPVKGSPPPVQQNGFSPVPSLPPVPPHSHRRQPPTQPLLRQWPAVPVLGLNSILGQLKSRYGDFAHNGFTQTTLTERTFSSPRPAAPFSRKGQKLEQKVAAANRADASRGRKKKNKELAAGEEADLFQEEDSELYLTQRMLRRAIQLFKRTAERFTDFFDDRFGRNFAAGCSQHRKREQKARKKGPHFA